VAADAGKEVRADKAVQQKPENCKKMIANVTVNSVIDRHPFSSGTLIFLVVGSMLIIYGVLFLILRMRK
jgi:hypothetical protein